jgi:hypothetical protein
LNCDFFSTEPPNAHSCKVTIQLVWWFLTRRFFKFQPMRTHYGPWQPCWISNQHQKHKSGRGPSSEHFWQVLGYRTALTDTILKRDHPCQVWFNLVQRFQRRYAEQISTKLARNVHWMVLYQICVFGADLKSNMAA